MATTTYSPLPSPLPPYPALSRLRESTPLERNASTSSSRSTTTQSSTTSSLVAVEMRPPPKETRTAASGALGSNDSSSSSSSDLVAPSPGQGAGRGYHTSPPEGIYGGRGFQRNGPRSSAASGGTGLPASQSAPNRRLPAIITDDTDDPPPSARPNSSYVPSGVSVVSGASGISPTTPRAGRFFTRPTGMEEDEDGPFGAGKSAGIPLSPYNKARAMSSGGPAEAWERERERRQSVASARSGTTVGSTTGGGAPRAARETTADYVFGEELGRGSYSTVVHAVRASTSSTLPGSPISPSRPPKQYAVKIINQAHLIQERKTKYAMIERDALVRLGAPRGAPAIGGPSGKGHRRVPSGSSAATPAGQRSRTSTADAPVGSSERRDSTTTMPGDIPSSSSLAPMPSPALSSSASTSSSTLDFSMMGGRAGRRPSRSADPPEVVPERSEDGHDLPMGVTGIIKSRPPSPVKEESPSRDPQSTPPSQIRQTMGYTPGTEGGERGQRAEKADGTSVPRTSKEASRDRSRRSGAGKGAHPGVIRLYSTFNDATSLYFVLDLASKGELLTYLRKYGSLDIESARYYAALLLDTMEFMHERGVVHRDLKPENILLDDDMRLKVTDFGSAKLLDKDGKDPKDQAGDAGPGGRSTKRSFVGSADFVSPEVLRNEPALAASDVWAFGCIVYQLIVGKPPFRGATDYLTFQKILKREMVTPDGFDEEAQALVDLILNLDPAARPTPSEMKSHPFFASINWNTVWQIPAPPMSTGITPPVATLATIDPASDMWAVFEDEMSDNGDSELPSPALESPSAPGPGGTEPRYDRRAAADAVWAVDAPDSRAAGTDQEDLEPPKPAWMEPGQRKLRALSKGSSARTSSSSSGGNRTALTGLLETMGIVGSNGSGGVSGRTSRASGSLKEGTEARVTQGMGAKGSPGQSGPVQRVQMDRRDDSGYRSDNSRWNQLLLTNEAIVHTSPISIRTPTSSLLPAFLSPGSSKRRQLILTDLPRLFTVKEESPGSAIHSAASLSAASQASLSVKNECVFWAGEGGAGGAGGGQSRVMEVLEKGQRGFTVQTPAQTFSYVADTAESRAEWMAALRQVMA